MRIALLGYARSGKGEVAKLISQWLVLNGDGMARTLSFGEELKKRFHEAFPEIPKEPKPRLGYEKFAKLARDFDEDFWVKCLDWKHKLLGEIYDNFTIDDLRQSNEAEWCRTNGFHIVYVQADPHLRKERSANDTEWVAINESEKEIGIIGEDYVIVNSGSMEELAQEVYNIMEEIACSER